jgi:hypothetical protein
MSRGGRRAALAALLLAAVAPAPGWGQAKARPPDAKKAAEKEKKVLRLEELEVEGKVRRPAVRALTPPGAIGGRERRESFLPKVLEAAEKEPF